jgi:hypothetical protein
MLKRILKEENVSLSVDYIQLDQDSVQLRATVKWKTNLRIPWKDGRMEGFYDKLSYYRFSRQNVSIDLNS